MIFLRSLFMMKTRNISMTFLERYFLQFDYFTSPLFILDHNTFDENKERGKEVV